MLQRQHILSLATVLAFAIPLGSACSSRGAQPSSAPEQLTEAPRQEPLEHDNGNGAPAQPLLAIESSPPGASRLHWAAEAGDLEQVKQLLDQGWDDQIDRKHSRGFSSLHEAARNGHADVVAVFMEAGADPNDTTAYGETSLHLAAQTGSAEVCKVLLEAGADPALLDQGDRTAMGVAIREGHTDVVRLFAETVVPDSSNGLHISSSDLYGAALHGHTEIMEILLKALGLNAFGGYYGRFDIVQGTHATRGTVDHDTPLHVAAANGHTEVAKLLVQAGAFLMAENNHDQTPFDIAKEQGHEDLAQMLKQSIQLFEAVENGDGDQARQLLAMDAQVDAIYDSDFGMPLHLAILAGQTDMAQLLVEAGANVNARHPWDSYYDTPLILAAAGGHTDMVKLLIDAGAELDARAAGGIHPLVTAIALGTSTDWGGFRRMPTFRAPTGHPNQEPARLLIQAGADPNNSSRFGTPVYQAIKNGATELVNLLIQAGLDVNAADHFNSTPLHQAVSSHHDDHQAAVHIAEALINAGANVNPKPNTPMTFLPSGTPLSLAAGRSNLAMVKLLIQHGANVNAKGRFDAPLHVAAQSGIFDQSGDVKLDIAQALIEAGADVNAKDTNYQGDSDNTPLHLAIHAGHGDLAKLLIASGADVQARNHAGNPPIQVAAFAGLPEVIKLLIEAGSPVNLQDHVGDTPLHDAALQGQVEAVQALIAAGADVQAVNNAGHTPLNLANQNGHENVAAVLKAAG